MLPAEDFRAVGVTHPAGPEGTRRASSADGRAGFQPRRKRRHGAHTTCASSLAQGLCLLGTGWANPRQAGLPVPPKLATNHSPLCGPEPTERATNHSPLATLILPGTLMQTGFPVTPSKQTTVVLSNRYKKPPPGGVATWLPFRPTGRISNRNTPETGFTVTLSKQTTAVLSNRNKKPPPPGEYLPG
jgi:hypothetical protein